jgi:predicted dehydrogenase
VHVPSLKLCSEMCEVLAVASRTEEKAAAFAAQWGIPRVYSDWRVLLGDPQIEAVVVCPPSGLTATVATAVIAAGKHILCEKPLGLTYADARALQTAAESADIVHMVAFTFRFVPALRYLKRLVAEGHFGEIRHWRLSYFTDFMLDPATPVAWRNQRAQAGAGILADMGSHGIDFARYLLGDIAAVRREPCTCGNSSAAGGRAGGRGRCLHLAVEFAGGPSELTSTEPSQDEAAPAAPTTSPSRSTGRAGPRSTN